MARKDAADEVTARLDRPKPKPKPLCKEDALSTGSTLLNLELSGMADGGFFPKRIYRFIGKSGSAKTFMTLTAFAEACKNPRYAKHRLIHDNPEDGAQMDFSYYFGEEVDRRVEPPGLFKGLPKQSRTVEEFCYRVNELTKKGDPFVYILDSIDALTTIDDQEHRKAVYAAIKAGKEKEVSGSYGTAKAKALSAGFNEIEANLIDSDSILIAISHAKVNIGRDAQFKPLTVSGGLSPQYFSHASIWTAVSGQITTKLPAKLGGATVKQGITVALKIDKNRQTGHEGRVIEVPVVNKLGIDDITSCIDYLIDTTHWTKDDNGKVTAPEFFDEPVRKAKLIESIEKANLEPELRAIVQGRWDEIEEAVNPNRKLRY